MKVLRLDHLVLAVENIDRTLRFYQVVLGMKVIHFAEGRVALEFGNQKINLHQKSSEFEPKAAIVQPGSADLCFIVDVILLTFVPIALHLIFLFYKDQSNGQGLWGVSLPCI